MWLSRNAGISALQSMLNLLQIPAMEACLPLAAAANIAMIAREPFAQGRLLPPKAAQGGLEFMGHAYDVRFEGIARRLGRTVPQLAVQYLAGTPGVAAVLAGMTSVEHIRENVAALSQPPLTESERMLIRSAALLPQAAPTGNT
jgi:aryl-alcohol dehydrogenase-like predicted oxidoreductase